MPICSQCHIGNLQPRKVSYANWHAGLFVVVPNAPAWQCDVCAYFEIDAELMVKLLPLLGPVTRPDPTQPRRGQPQRPGDGRWPATDSDHGRP